MKQLFKDKKYWKEMALLLLFGLLVNIACFCMPMVGHCANVTSVLPYLCQSENSFYNQEEIDNILSLINSRYPEEDIYNKKFIISLGYESQWYTYSNYIEVPTYRVYILPDSNNYATTWALNTNFENFVMDNSSYYVDLAIVPFTSYTCAPTTLQPDNMNISKSTSAGVTNLRLFGAYNPHTINNNIYQVDVPMWNYPVYTNTLVSTTDPMGASGYILGFNNSIVIGDFAELPPIDDILNNITGNYTPHSNDTPPTYDSSLSEGQNIANAITGHSNNMNNAINNLGENIENFFNKLYEKLTNVGNAVSTNIHNGFATLMQNIKDFFGAKLDAIIDRISQKQEESQQEIVDAFTGSNMYTDFDRISQVSQQAFSVWSDTAEPNSFKIPLHLEELPILHVEQCQYIDVGLFSPCFPYIRGIMWCFLVYSVLYTVIDSIANYINGGDE